MLTSHFKLTNYCLEFKNLKVGEFDSFLKIIKREPDRSLKAMKVWTESTVSKHFDALVEKNRRNQLEEMAQEKAKRNLTIDVQPVEVQGSDSSTPIASMQLHNLKMSMPSPTDYLS